MQYVCPFVDEEGVQMRDDCPQTVLRRLYAGADFEWIFTGTFAERVHMYDPVSAPRTAFWGSDVQPLSETGKRVVDCLKAILHQLTVCMQDNNDLALYLYFDAHVPLAVALESADSLTDETVLRLAREHAPDPNNVLFEGTLPDVVNDLFRCTFWNETKTKMEPIVHLLCKSLPQRCQIRNLNAIISNYCQEHDRVFTFMLRTVICSLLGNYSHATQRLSPRARMVVLKHWVIDPPNRTQIQEWLFSRHQHFLFYVIKECLTYMIQMIPALFDAIRDVYKWPTFESCVHAAMDMSRKTLNTTVHHSTRLADWLREIEPALLAVNKQQLGNLFRPQRMTFCQTVLQVCSRLDETRHEARLYVELPRDYRDILRAMCRRIPLSKTVPIEWLQYFNVSNDIISRLQNMQTHFHQSSFRSELRKLMTSLDRLTFETIRELFQCFDEVHNHVRIFYLPQHMYEAQKRALHTRFSIPQNQPLPDHVSTTLVCLTCRTFKGFVVKRSDKVSNLFANGHHKITIDDETLICYCGRRTDQNDSKKRQKMPFQAFEGDDWEMEEANKRAAKRDWKMQRKKWLNHECFHTPCMKMHLLGVLFQFYNHLYYLCPLCASPTVFDPLTLGEHGLHCGQCTRAEAQYGVSCVLCDTQRGTAKWNTLTYLKDEETKTDVICKDCEKLIEREGGPFTLDVYKNMIHMEV